MDIQSSDWNELFELFPVWIPGWKQFEPGDIAHGGIPKSIYNDTKSLLCVVDPWTVLQRDSRKMEEYDQVELYVNNGRTPVATHTVLKDEVNNRIGLYIPPKLLINGVNDLHYNITRGSQNFGKSEALQVLYHSLSPGEPPETNMVLELPPEIRANESITAQQAEAGVKFGFKYTYQRNLDEIEFNLGTVTRLHNVTAPAPPLVDTLFTQTFKEAMTGRTAEAGVPVLPFWYRVTDRLGNSNESVPILLKIDLEGVPLSIDPSDYSQSASDYFIVRGRPPTMPPDDATATYMRTATGGTAPYVYTSSDNNIAMVDSGSGLVRAAGNGVARITATDANKSTVSYQITFSNVRWVERVDGMWWDANYSAARPDPEVHLDMTQMKRFWALYFPSHGPVAIALGWPPGWYWSSTNVWTDGTAWAVNLDSDIPEEKIYPGSNVFPAIKRL
ncbi:hypothetical protein J3P95_07985 [Pseudomonas sp. Z5-35]|uniref:Ig-like domain-containing protein n=1 Tax=unclassified Pseudomonas TaxID=196821 RepID=UPI003DA99BF3